MEICAANIKEFNQGESNGIWFELPININEFEKDLNLPCGNDYYVILDSKNVPFTITNETTIEELNRLYYSFNKLDEHFKQDLQEILINTDLTVEELIENIKAGTIIFHSDAHNNSNIRKNPNILYTNNGAYQLIN